MVENEISSSACCNAEDTNIDLFDSKTTTVLEADLDTVDKLSVVKMELDQTLENAINEMNSLQKEYSQGEAENLIELCKDNVMTTIVGQFGLASLFVEAKDGGSVTTTHNFEKGVTANKDDEARYQDWHHVTKEGGFKERRPLYDKRKDELRNQDKMAGTKIVKDEYTGDSISIKRADVDHVISAKEIETDSAGHLFMNQEDRVKMGTDDVNLAYTKDKANRSKGSKKMEDWLDKKDEEGRTNEERFGIDRERALAKDKAARKHMSKTINKAAFKKYSKELLATGGKDAAKMAAYSAVGVIMHDLSLAVVEELKYILKNRGNKTFKELFRHFKEKMAEVCDALKKKWKDIVAGSLEAGVVAFLSNIVVFIINIFATTLKKIVSMIRAGFVSLCQAIKLMVHHPEDMTQDEANYQAIKILTAGLIGALSLGLSASIEKFLQAIPGLQPIMMFPIPSFGGEPRTVSDIIAVTLSAVVGGLVTTIVLYYMDRFMLSGKKDKLQIQLVSTSGVVVQCQIAKGWCSLYDAYDFLGECLKSDVEACLAADQIMTESSERTKTGLKGWDAIRRRMGK